MFPEEKLQVEATKLDSISLFYNRMAMQQLAQQQEHYQSLLQELESSTQTALDSKQSELFVTQQRCEILHRDIAELESVARAHERSAQSIHARLKKLREEREFLHAVNHQMILDLKPQQQQRVNTTDSEETQRLQRLLADRRAKLQKLQSEVESVMQGM